QVPLGRERLGAFGALLEDLAEKADAGRAVALEHATLGPPQYYVVGQVGLAVTDVGAADRALPETPDHLFGGDVAPALVDVAFVGALVDHDGFAPFAAPFGRVLGGLVDVDALQARVRHPRAAVVEERTAVVVGEQVPVRV